MRVIAGFDLFNAGTSVLCDMRFVTFDADADGFEFANTEPTLPQAAYHGYGIAIVAGSDSGFTQMCEIAATCEHERHQTEVFRSLDSAGEWIGLAGLDDAFPADVEPRIAAHVRTAARARQCGLVLLKDTCA